MLFILSVRETISFDAIATKNQVSGSIDMRIGLCDEVAGRLPVNIGHMGRERSKTGFVFSNPWS